MRKTKKTTRALEILSREEFADSDLHSLSALVKKRGVTAAQVCAAVEHFGYRWNGKTWLRKFPTWLENLILARDRGLLKDVDPLSRAVILSIGKSTRQA